jgi:hypothetical protein
MEKENNVDRQNLRSALAAGLFKDAKEIAEKIFSDESADENVLAWTAGVLFEKHSPDALFFLRKFIERFPMSLHPARVYVALLFSERQDFDLSTYNARLYLRVVNDVRGFASLNSSPIVQDGAGRAFLLMTSAYTELGARSYSKRVLMRALHYEFSAAFRSSIQAELARLDGELALEAVSLTDQAWEEFFRCGKGRTDLESLCLGKNCPIFAQRVSLLATKFTSDPSFAVTAEEVLMIQIAEGDGWILV